MNQPNSKFECFRTEADFQVELATGAVIRPEALASHRNLIFRVTEAGVSETLCPAENTRIINDLIRQASRAGGGMVLIPQGIYPVYTICMQSNVTLRLEQGAVLRAAIPVTEGGNYDEPETNLFAGIQDHGHTYLANSLIYGKNLQNISITGPGVLDGSNYHIRQPGEPLEYILNRWDPPFPDRRSAPGHQGVWFGNKGIALDGCDGIVLTGFTFLIGGHFALLLSGCRNIWMDHLLVDTIRDALDLDGCQDVTLRNSIFNSLNDDAICLKASFGAKKFMPVRNILVEDCKVMGFDAGSVFAGKYSRDKLAATDRCKPCGRVKFGTEASCGCDTVTVRRVEFIRSRGLCLESCDTADLHDILVEDCRMREVSSSPVFIRLGIRNRFPVTGEHSEDTLVQVRSDPFLSENERAYRSPRIRLDHPEWVLPLKEEYPIFPPAGYTPSVRRTHRVSVDGLNFFSIPDPSHPLAVNPANFAEAKDQDGNTIWYVKKWDSEQKCYTRDPKNPLTEEDLPLYANAYGSAPGNTVARAWNIVIRNMKVEDADPRYPILLQGLTDSRIRNVLLENICVTWRGGLTWEMATEQRQLNTLWHFSQFGAPRDAQILPWLVNTFFAKNEGLLPRLDWDPKLRRWVPDPYNVPELADVYPEPSNYGILPAYGLYARHVEGLTLQNVHFSLQSEDERDAVVLDDASGITLRDLKAEGKITLVKSPWRRPSGKEMVPDLPYHEEKVESLCGAEKLSVREITLSAPAPGTPPDHLYPWPTSAVPEMRYQYSIPTEIYPLPRSIYRPYAVLLDAGEQQKNTLLFALRDPAGDAWEEILGDTGTGEIITQEPTVNPQPVHLQCKAFLRRMEERIPLKAEPAFSSQGMINCFRVQLPENRTARDSVEILLMDGFREEICKFPL